MYVSLTYIIYVSPTYIMYVSPTYIYMVLYIACFHVIDYNIAIEQKRDYEALLTPGNFSCYVAFDNCDQIIHGS